MGLYIALLRGINVGGKNKIKMADLKQMFERMGFNGVQTYIQSGNVLFESQDDETDIKERLEKEIQNVFGISTTIVLRTSREIEQIVLNCPFSSEDILEAESTGEGESLYVALLTHCPAKDRVELLGGYKSEDDKYVIKGREVYLLFHRSIRNSKLANNLNKLDVPATVRNWKTISKLLAMAKERT